MIAAATDAFRHPHITFLRTFTFAFAIASHTKIIMVIIRPDHRITDLEFKIYLHFDIVHKGIGYIMLISLAKSLPIFPHG